VTKATPLLKAMVIQAHRKPLNDMVNNDNDLITNTVRTRETTVRISRMV